MNCFVLLVSAVLGAWDPRDMVLPALTAQERKMLTKFENPHAFETAWKAAGIKLHEDIDRIRHKGKKHHKKVRKVVYVDEPDM